jgi:NAD+ synthase (glutamine-hydrolysing)
MFGFYRVAVATFYTTLANPMENAQNIISVINKIAEKDCSILLLPELALTGYTLRDILYQESIYKAQNEALENIVRASQNLSTVIVFGVYVNYLDRLYNCAVVIQNGKILGLIPKSYIPNRGEFYEKRYFTSGKDLKGLEIDFCSRSVPFGVDLLFGDKKNLIFGVEVCEDLWAVTPPSLKMCESGANLILNPSSSNELVGKSDYRKSLVSSQSARGFCAYAYSSSSIGESSTDTVFGGDLIVAEYGSILAQGKRFSFEEEIIFSDIDTFRLKALRLKEGSFCDSKTGNFRFISLQKLPEIDKIKRFINPYPFIPSNKDKLNSRAEEIINIQAHSLIRRLRGAKIQKVVIGVSGGLDSTLALLVCYYAFEILGRDPKDIIAVLMPGFGTTDRTFENSILLSKSLNISYTVISIKKLAELEFEAIGHNPAIKNITYENVQARARTSILMNLANQENALVIGTGDLSEIALGWSTYNGDHMSMYAINSSIPKTLIRYLIEFFAQKSEDIKGILEDILDTPVSPELLPPEDGKISQKTEDIIGPYELHDFFLYHFIRYGSSIKRIFYLATLAFEDKYEPTIIKKWLGVFIRRFFTQQFKRSCMPDGPKVGTISLSPRTDWRMPSDADFQIWMRELEEIKI